MLPLDELKLKKQITSILEKNKSGVTTDWLVTSLKLDVETVKKYLYLYLKDNLIRQ